VVATHGRAIWVLDNLAPLRALGMSSWIDEEGNAGGMLLRLSTE